MTDKTQSDIKPELMPAKIESQELEKVVEKIVVSKLESCFGEKSTIEEKRATRWQGPLPPQFFENLTPDLKTRLLDDLKHTKEKQESFQRYAMDAMLKDNQDERSSSKFKIVLISLLVAGIFVFCVAVKSTEIIEKLLPLIATGFGGGGLAVILIQKTSSKSSKDKDVKQLFGEDDFE